jgi:hypothetical protein
MVKIERCSEEQARQVRFALYRELNLCERISNDHQLESEDTLSLQIEQKETTMKRYLPVITALAMSLMSSALIPSLKASDVDKKTIITISQPVAVEGTILSPGQYVLQLQISQSSRDIVRIFNSDGTLVATFLAIHAYRLQPTAGSEFKFYNSPVGQPTALHTWFYPGDGSGFEFRQPKKATAPVSVEAGG